MRIRAGILVLIFAISSIALPAQAGMSGPKNTDFDFDYSLHWTPLFVGSVNVTFKGDSATHLVAITFVESRRIRGRMAEFIAGPFSSAELEAISIETEKNGITGDPAKLYSLIKNRPLFVVEYILEKGMDSTSIKLYKRGSRWFEFWRAWRPHWIFVTDFKDLAPEQQIRYMEDKFGIKGWIDY